MKDLEYIIGIGFSGADLPRAIILAFIFAMFARKDTNVWVYGLFALLIDRTVWPIAAMGASGADIQAIYASIGGLYQTFMDDLGLLLCALYGPGHYDSSASRRCALVFTSLRRTKPRTLKPSFSPSAMQHPTLHCIVR